MPEQFEIDDDLVDNWELDGTPYEENPKEYLCHIDRNILAIFQYCWASNGMGGGHFQHLPEAGGINDQCSWLVAALSCVKRDMVKPMEIYKERNK